MTVMPAQSNKRQYIILGLMVLAIIYGAWELWPTSGSRPRPTIPGQPAADFSGFQAELMARRPAPAGDVEARLITAAETPWEQSPFAAPETLAAWRNAQKAPVVEEKPLHLEYTGFIDTGHQRLAIINELDYAPGDMLAMYDYRVRRIEPDRVTLENVVNGTFLELLIQEMEVMGEH